MLDKDYCSWCRPTVDLVLDGKKQQPTTLNNILSAISQASSEKAADSFPGALTLGLFSCRCWKA